MQDFLGVEALNCSVRKRPALGFMCGCYRQCERYPHLEMAGKNTEAQPNSKHLDPVLAVVA